MERSLKVTVAISGPNIAQQNEERQILFPNSIFL